MPTVCRQRQLAEGVDDAGILNDREACTVRFIQNVLKETFVLKKTFFKKGLLKKVLKQDLPFFYKKNI